MTKKEILQKLEALQKEVREWGEDKDWPTNGDIYFYLSSAGGICSATWVRDSELKQGDLEMGNCFRTKEDATLMRDWLKAQRLTWMPEEGAEWWTSDTDDQHAYLGSRHGDPAGFEVASGNVHKTKEEAEAYGKLMKAVAKLKTDYLV